jgi:hypothetical protein
MDLIMNGLLLTATLFAGLYCWVLSGRVRALKSLDSGLGAAIVTLTRQIELARGTLEEARSAARDGRADLSQLVARGDATAAQLRILLAALKDHDPAVAPMAAPTTASATAPVAEPAARAADVASAPIPSPPETADLRADHGAGGEVALPRRIEPTMPRLVVPEPEAPPPAVRPPAELERPVLASVPKPRLAIPLENILRSRQPVEPPVQKSESELLDALNALAAGDR